MTIAIRIVSLLFCVVAALPAQQPVSSGAFVVRLGTDTLSVERFTRTSTRLEGDLVRRIPTTSVVHYVLNLGPDGALTHASLVPRAANGSMIRGMPSLVEMAFDGDSATMTLVRDTTIRRRVSAPHAFIMLPESYAVYEAWLAQLRMRHADSADVVNIAPLGGPSGRMPVKMLADSARAWFFGSPLLLRVDAQGRLLGLDGRATTIKYEVTRVPDADIQALATGFAALDAQGKSFGQWVSARDTVRAQVGGASIWVDYGRPRARGRDLYAYGVLGDTLWRTGANAATQFRTDRDMTVGGQPLKAGTYTLWTRVAPDNTTYSLVFNSQVGQWGTEHHADRDLFAVPLRAEPMSATDQFTIQVEPSGALSLLWGGKRLSTMLVP